MLKRPTPIRGTRAKIELPQLFDEPKHHPDCCASLSKKLLAILEQILSADTGLVLSIGSGSGLFEALLVHLQPALTLQAVEVSQDVNIYLPEEKVWAVDWTGGLCDAAGDAVTWIFIYPRSMNLLRKYLSTFGDGKVQTILIIIPRLDYLDLDAVFSRGSWQKEVIEDSGLAEYEMLVHWRRHPK